MEYGEIVQRLKSLGTRRNVEGMARFAITPEKAYGVTTPNIRKLARD